MKIKLATFTAIALIVSGLALAQPTPHEIEPGKKVTLTANPVTGWKFVHFEITGLNPDPAPIIVTTSPYEFTMPDNEVTVQAVFEEIVSTRTMTLTVVGQGSVSVTVGDPVADALNFLRRGVVRRFTPVGTD